MDKKITIIGVVTYAILAISILYLSFLAIQYKFEQDKLESENKTKLEQECKNLGTRKHVWEDECIEIDIYCKEFCSGMFNGGSYNDTIIGGSATTSNVGNGNNVIYKCFNDCVYKKTKLKNETKQK
jgi:hypothetical protein